MILKDLAYNDNYWLIGPTWRNENTGLVSRGLPGIGHTLLNLLESKKANFDKWIYDFARLECRKKTLLLLYELNFNGG